MIITEGDTIKVARCGNTEEHLPHFWHGGGRFCTADWVIVGEWDVEKILAEVRR